MKLYFFISGLFLSFSIYGNPSNPCKAVNFDNIEEYSIPMDRRIDRARLSTKALKTEIKLLKNCINKYAVCIVEANSGSVGWYSKKLKEPKNNNFDPVKRDLVFGMIQYFDKKRKLSVCIIANNAFVNALPWYGRIWVDDGNNVVEYELEEVWFDSVMTPRRLYNAFLSSYEEKMKAIE